MAKEPKIETLPLVDLPATASAGLPVADLGYTARRIAAKDAMKEAVRPGGSKPIELPR